MSRHLMFNPGPTNVHDDVRQALLAPDANHRDPLFAEVLGRVRAQIRLLMGVSASHTCVPFVASGTGANEAVFANIEGVVAVAVAGPYSARLAEIAERTGLGVVRIAFDPLQGIDPETLDAAIASHPELTHLCLVHHETTTGIVAPLAAVAGVAEHWNLRLIVDGISSIFGEDLGAARSRVDYYTLSANKCLESVPGLSFVVARRELVEDPAPRARSYYFDLNRQWRDMESVNGPPFTHGYAHYCAADVALGRLSRETVAARCARYRLLRDRLRGGLASFGIEHVTADPARQSNFLQLYRVPRGFNFRWLHDRLLSRDITIYTDQQTLSDGYMYFATLGSIGIPDVDKLLECLHEELRDMPGRCLSTRGNGAAA